MARDSADGLRLPALQSVRRAGREVLRELRQAGRPGRGSSEQVLLGNQLQPGVLLSGLWHARGGLSERASREPDGQRQNSSRGIQPGSK